MLSTLSLSCSIFSSSTLFRTMYGNMQTKSLQIPGEILHTWTRVALSDSGIFRLHVKHVASLSARDTELAFYESFIDATTPVALLTSTLDFNPGPVDDRVYMETSAVATATWTPGALTQRSSTPPFARARSQALTTVSSGSWFLSFRKKVLHFATANMSVMDSYFCSTWQPSNWKDAATLLSTCPQQSLESCKTPAVVPVLEIGIFTAPTMYCNPSIAHSWASRTGTSSPSIRKYIKYHGLLSLAGDICNPSPWTLSSPFNRTPTLRSDYPWMIAD